jgi:iron complex transport system ATP-binding protein
MSRVLQIHDLKTAYFVGKKNQRILHHIKKAYIEKGEFISVLGLNGSGKTTLIRSILGMQKVVSGQVIFNDRDSKNLDVKELSRIVAVVLTDKIDDAFLRVRELVSLGRFPHVSAMGNLNDTDLLKIMEAIKIMKLEHYEKRIFSQLSDGEKQRVLIARSIAQDTPLIILDEPAAFIDSPGKLSIMKMLKNLSSNKSKSVLLTTHDIESALRFSDKIWLLSPDGKFIVGEPKKIVDSGLINEYFDKDGIVFNRRNLNFEIEADNIIEPIKH